MFGFLFMQFNGWLWIPATTYADHFYIQSRLQSVDLLTLTTYSSYLLNTQSPESHVAGAKTATLLDIQDCSQSVVLITVLDLCDLQRKWLPVTEKHKSFFVFRYISELLIYPNINRCPKLLPWHCASMCIWAFVVWFYLEQWTDFLESNSACALSCSKSAPSHVHMPHNAIASQAASATLLTPLAAVRLNTWKFQNVIDKNTSV